MPLYRSRAWRQRPKLASSCRPAGALVERLEARALLTAVTFTAAGDGINWSDPNNWSNHQLPGPTDDATVNLAAGRSVAINNFIPPVHSVTTANPITISNGVFSVGTTITTSALITVDGGTLQGATVNGSGSVNVALGTVDHVTLNVAAVDMAPASGSPAVQVLNGLTVNKTLTISPSTSSGAPTTLDFHGLQTLAGTGQVNLVQFNFSIIHISDAGSPATLTVAPTLTIQGGGLITSDVDATLLNQGMILANEPSQTLRVSAAMLINQGTITNQNGGMIGLNAAGNGSGTLTFSGGTADVNGTAAATTVSITGGTASFDTTMPLSFPTLNLSGGTLDGDADITIASSSSFTGGTMTGNGGTFLAQAAVLNVANPVSHIVARPFNNAGQVNVNGGTLELDGAGNHAGTFSVDQTATLALGGAAAQNFNGSSNVAGPGTVMVKDTGSAFVAGVFSANVTMVQDYGSLTFAGTSDRTGSLLINGGTVQIGARLTTARKAAGANVVQVLNQHVITDGTTVVLPGWTLEDEGLGLQFVGSSGPTVSLTSDAIAPGTLELAGNVTFAGTGGTAAINSIGAAPQPGQLDLLGGTRSFTVNDGTSPVDFSISAHIVDGGVRKAGAGTMRLTAANAFAGGTSLANGTLEIDDPNSLSGGSITFAGGILALRVANLALANNLVVDPADSIDLDLGATALQLNKLFTGSALNVSGLPGGSLAVNGTVTLQNDLVVNDSVPITLNGPISGVFGITKAGGGTLALAGTVADTFAGNTQVNAGTLVLSHTGGPAVPQNLRIDGPATVVTQQDRQFSPATVITFDNAAGESELDLANHAQTIASITSFQSNAGTVQIGTGALIISSGSYTGTMLGSGALTKQGAGTLILGGSLAGPALAITGGAIDVTVPFAGNTVRALSISPGAKLDLGSSILFVQYGASASPAAMIRSLLATGLLKAASTLGFADSADGVVTGLPANSVVIKPAIAGDANLDGKVNFQDLLLLAQHFGAPAANWDQGDFNYDGVVNFNDLLALAQNFGKTAAVGASTNRPSRRASLRR